MNLNSAYWSGFLKAAETPVANVPPTAKTNALSLLKFFEGFAPKAYKDPGGPYNAVGYGFNLSPDNRSIFERLFGTSPSFDAVNQGTARLTEPQASQLLAQKMNAVSNTAYKAFPQLPAYKPELQGAIINGYYRGDLSGSPKAIKLMQGGNWQAGAKEYLNNREYRNALAKGSGVAKRMGYNAQIFSRQQPQSSLTSK